VDAAAGDEGRLRFHTAVRSPATPSAIDGGGGELGARIGPVGVDAWTVSQLPSRPSVPSASTATIRLGLGVRVPLWAKRRPNDRSLHFLCRGPRVLRPEQNERTPA
jgi:hypothetical protein